jgi:RNA polymerase sigma-70 factor (ECF subfamily)
MEINEEKIIRDCQAGELNGFGEIYDKYAPKIYSFIYHKTSHKENTEDLVSKTFFKALKNINKYNQTGGSFSSWLYQIARNIVIDYYRTKKDTIDITDAYNLKSDEDMKKNIENSERIDEIKKYLGKLKPEQKEIIIMRVWDELSYKEIAKIIGKSEGSCKMLFSRATNTLRKNMPISLFIFFLLNLK